MQNRSPRAEPVLGNVMPWPRLARLAAVAVLCCAAAVAIVAGVEARRAALAQAAEVTRAAEAALVDSLQDRARLIRAALLSLPPAADPAPLFRAAGDGAVLLDARGAAVAGVPPDPAGVAALLALARGAGAAEPVQAAALALPGPTGGAAQVLRVAVAIPERGWVLALSADLPQAEAALASARAALVPAFLSLGAAAILALVVLALAGLVLLLSDRRQVDLRLKELTQRVFDTQEEERGRVARELHDSISQILVGVRYTFELAGRRLLTGDARAGESIEKGIDTLNGAIQEVRRISRDLRPGVLDDLGLGPALQALAEEFGRRTGIAADFETNVFRNRLDQEAKIALYRIAQEALTNVERHSGADRVSLLIRGTKQGALLRIQDNGHGFTPSRNGAGLGLRNMKERIDKLDGTLRILSSKTGTLIEAEVPLSHMLPPETQVEESA